MTTFPAPRVDVDVCAPAFLEGGVPVTHDSWDDILRGNFTGKFARNFLRSVADWGVKIPGMEALARAGLTLSSITGDDPVYKLLMGYVGTEVQQANELTLVAAKVRPFMNQMENDGFKTVRKPLEHIEGKTAITREAGRILAGGVATGELSFNGDVLAKGFSDIAEQIQQGDMVLKFKDGGEMIAPDSLRGFVKSTTDFIQIAVEQVEALTGERMFPNATDSFWPRLVLNEKTGRTGLAMSLGAKPSNLKIRLNETMDDLIEKGVPYADPMSTFEHYITSLQKMARDTILADKMLDEGVSVRAQKPLAIAKFLKPEVVDAWDTAQKNVIDIAKRQKTDRASVIRERTGLERRRDQLQRRLTRESQGLGKAIGQEDIRTQPSGRGQTNKQEQDLLQRDARVAATKSEIAEINEALNNLPSVRVAGRGKGNFGMTKESIAEFDDAMVNLKTTQSAYRQNLDNARQIAATGDLGQASGRRLGPALAQQYLSKDDIIRLERVLNTQTNTFFKTTAAIASWPRFLQTGLADVGHFGIQMSLLLSSRPNNFAKAAVQGFQAIFDPDGKAIGDLLNSPMGRKAVNEGHIDVSGGLEQTEAARGIGPFSERGLIGRIPVLGGFVRAVPRGFDAALVASRVHEWNSLNNVLEKGWEKHAAKAGLTPEDLVGEKIRLGAYVDTKLGTPNMRRLGMGSTQDAIERGWIFYSNRYFRSTLGMLGWAMSNGIPAQDARASLLNMAAGATLTFSALGTAMGMDEKEILERLNPQSGGKFFSLPVAGNEYGFGGGIRSLTAFIGSLTERDNWDFDTWSERQAQNPFARFLRGKTAPPSSALLDFIMGEDFLGEQVSIDEFVDSPELTFQYFSELAMPFNLRAALEARGGIRDAGLAAGIETVGGRTSPRSGFNLLEEVRESEFQRRADSSPDGFDYDRYSSYEDLFDENRYRAKLISETDGVRDAQARLELEGKNRKESDDERYFNAVDAQREAIRVEQDADDTALREYWRDFSTGIEPGEWRRRTSGRTTGWIGAIEALGSKEGFDIEFEDAFEPGTVNWGIEQFFAVDFDKFVSEIGVVDISGFRNAQQKAIGGLTAQQQADVRAFVSFNKTDLQQLHSAHVKTIENTKTRIEDRDIGFWDISPFAWEMTQQAQDGLPKTREEYERLRMQQLRNQGIPLVRIASELKRDPVIKFHNDRKKLVKDIWVTGEGNNDILFLLQQWGYKDVAIKELHLFDGNENFIDTP